MLAPIIPHICHQLWQELGQTGSMLDQAWPKVDKTALVQSSIEMVIQVNGKLKGKMQVNVGMDQAACEAMALENKQVAQLIGQQSIRKVIVVPGKLVNIVV